MSRALKLDLRLDFLFHTLFQDYKPVVLDAQSNAPPKSTPSVSPPFDLFVLLWEQAMSIEDCRFLVRSWLAGIE